MGLFGKKSDNETKLSGPRVVPGHVEKYLLSVYKINPEWVPFLKAVTKNNAGGSKGYDIRIFDQSDADARKVEVKNYSSLDNHPELTMYSGSYDESTNKVELKEQKKPDFETQLFTENELVQRIDALKEPGSTIFFYQSRGPARGGPLGMGAAVIELNPAYPGNKQKKFNVYTADIVDLRPVGKGILLTTFNDSKHVATWIKDGLTKRTYA